MLEINKCTLTEIGQAEILQAITDKTTVTWEKACVGSGDISGTNKTTLTKLTNEEWEGEILEFERIGNELSITTYIPLEVGGFEILEAGIKNKDGKLVVIVECDLGFKEVGSEELTLKFNVNVKDSSIIYVVTSSDIFATKSDLENVTVSLEECDKDDIDEIVGEIKKLNLIY